MLAETVAVLVAHATGCWVALSEDGSADCATISLQYDVMCRRADVVVVVVQVQRECQQ